MRFFVRIFQELRVSSFDAEILHDVYIKNDFPDIICVVLILQLILPWVYMSSIRRIFYSLCLKVIKLTGRDKHPKNYRLASEIGQAKPVHFRAENVEGSRSPRAFTPENHLSDWRVGVLLGRPIFQLKAQTHYFIDKLSSVTITDLARLPQADSAHWLVVSYPRDNYTHFQVLINDYCSFMLDRSRCRNSGKMIPFFLYAFSTCLTLPTYS